MTTLEGSFSEEKKKKEMIQDLEVIKHHLEVGYAPMAWKKEQMHWSLEEAFEESKNKVLDTPSITTKQFQQIVRNFLNSTQDYHVSALFVSTEMASLPFSIKGVKGRYFIDWIDPLRLPPSQYGIKVGDELLEFDGRPITEVIEELKRGGNKSNPSTDQTFAEIKLTFRSGQLADTVPQGPISITVQSSSNRKRSYQLQWFYTSEHITNAPDRFLPMKDWPLDQEEMLKIPQKLMTSTWLQLHSERWSGHKNGGLGASKSFVPRLGKTIWIKKQAEENRHLPFLFSFDIPWHAYIYLHPDKYLIGYIRIPHYMGSEESADEFGEIINFMEGNTDALVIDQLNNTGGYAPFQYKLASMLAIHPLITPYHQMKLTQKEVLEAYRMLQLISLIEGVVDHLESSPKLEEDSSNDGLGEMNYQQLLFLKAYYEFILEEWETGHFLTRATPILGMDRINPCPKYQYTKPILLLINEMDFSGGDFLPAILQDNKRALLFGSRTAGAGGCVSEFEFPNCHGIASCSYTISIAERPNLEKIENRGVIPDIEYELTIEDIQDGYQDYKEAVNRAVKQLLQNSSP